MLIAKNKSNELKNTILDLINKTDKFSCPSCEQKVIFVDSIIKVKHFRHKTKSQCDFEPESEEHILMKQQLCEFLGLNPQTDIENNLIFAKPDLRNEKYAIECQASPISTNKFLERTYNYHKNGYYVLWIFSSKLFMKNIMKKIIRKIYYNRVYFYDTEKKELYSRQWNGLKKVIPQEHEIFATEGQIPEEIACQCDFLLNLERGSYAFRHKVNYFRKIKIARINDVYEKDLRPYIEKMMRERY